MKRLASLMAFAACGWADEAADRTAIGRVIVALNEMTVSSGARNGSSVHPELFTADSEGPAVIEQLRKGKRLKFQLRQPAPSASDHATVTISHDPWREVVVNLPMTMEITNPRIESRTIRFITPDVALADAISIYEGGTVEMTRLLFVMKKVGDGWKIASLRALR